MQLVGSFSQTPKLTEKGSKNFIISQQITKMCGNGKSRLCILWLTCLLQALNALPVAQNPMEVMGMGIMTAVSSVGEVLSNGAAARKEHGIKTGFFEMNSKSEVGMGQAIKPPTTSDESDEDRRRRKRSNNVIIGEEQLLPLEPKATAAHPHIHRDKRSPCRFGTGAGTGGTGGAGGTGGSPDPVADGTDYIDGAERRRRQRKRKAAQRRKKSQGGTKTKSGKQKGTKKQSKVVTRRRRQANAGDGKENQFGQQAQQFAQRVQTAVESFMGTMVQVVKTVQQTFSGPGGGQQRPQGGYQ